MQPLFQHIYLKNNESYNILYVDRPYFVVPWHYHLEIELMLILQGEGSRIVGDSIEHFQSGDLVIIGSNLLHCWKSGSIHYQASAENSRAHVILFRDDSFGENFFKCAEFKNIRQLLKKASRGIKFSGQTRQIVTEKICKAYAEKGVKRFSIFLEILEDLAESMEYELLASEVYKPEKMEFDMQRMNMVLDYLMENFRKTIRLEDISSLACMSPTSFCRYFKARTNKSFGRFLNELRIGYAKNLLLTTDKNISEISLESGFINLPNFYDQFSKIAGCTPGDYKKIQLKAIS